MKNELELYRISPGSLTIHSVHPSFELIKKSWESWTQIHTREYKGLTAGGDSLFHGPCSMIVEMVGDDEQLRFKLPVPCNDKKAFEKLLKDLEKLAMEAGQVEKASSTECAGASGGSGSSGG